jgi:hypothetical protein
VVGRHEPTRKEAGLVIMIVRMVVMRIEAFMIGGDGGHDGLSS